MAGHGVTSCSLVIIFVVDADIRDLTKAFNEGILMGAWVWQAMGSQVVPPKAV